MHQLPPPSCDHCGHRSGAAPSQLPVSQPSLAVPPPVPSALPPAPVSRADLRSSLTPRLPPAPLPQATRLAPADQPLPCQWALTLVPVTRRTPMHPAHVSCLAAPVPLSGPPLGKSTSSNGHRVPRWPRLPPSRPRRSSCPATSSPIARARLRTTQSRQMTRTTTSHLPQPPLRLLTA
jgi:hypothetical protein